MDDFQVDESWEQSFETKTDSLSANNESAEFDEYEVDGDLYKSKEFIPEPTREVSYYKQIFIKKKKKMISKTKILKLNVPKYYFVIILSN